MQQELISIKNKIIDRIISVTTVLLIPIYFLSVLRTIDIGWQKIFFLHTFLFLLFLGLYFFRRRLKFELKTHILSILFVVIGAQGLLFFGFAGGYYFCIIAILLNAILIGRKQAIIYFIAIAIVYSAIAAAILLQFIKPQIDLNQYQLYPTSWITLFFGTLYIAFVILTAASELYKYFIKTISEKDATSIELKESENRLQDIIDNIPALIFLKDKNSVYKFVNSNFLKVFNVKHSVKGKTDFELFDKEVAKGFRTDDKRVISSLKPEKIEETFSHLNKTYTYLTQKLPIKTTTNEVELLGTSIDITERKKTEEALYQNEQQLRHIFDNSPAIMLLLNEKAEIVKVNRTGFEFAGAIFDQVMNKQFGEAFCCINSSDGEDCNNSKACKNCTLRNITFNTIHENKSSSRVETQLALLRNGEIEHFDVLLSSSLISEKPKKTILITIDDITSIRKTEQALIESEERLKTAQKIGKIGHWYLDIVNNYLEWSDEVYRIFELNPQEFYATYEAFLERIHPEDRERVDVAYINSLKTRKPYKITHRLKLKSNKIKYVVEKCKTEFDTDGNPLQSIGTVQDITERILAEKALKDSEAQLKGAESLARTGHYYYEINNDNFKWSDEVFRIFDVSPDNIIPSYGTFFDFIHSDDKEELNNAFEKSLREKHTLHLEHRLLLKNGKLKYVNHKIRTEFNSKGQPVTTMGAIMDITQLKLTQLELIKHKENLEQLVKERTEELQAANKLVFESYEELYTKNELINEQKADLEASLNRLKKMQLQLIQSEKMASLGVLTAGVAHEINNPLNFIYGGNKGLEMYFENNIKDHLESVTPLMKAINEGVKRISDIVTGLSQFSDDHQLSAEECDIHSIIDNCLAILYSEIRQKAEINKSYTSEIYKLIGNTSELHQVVLNILINSLQAIDKRGVINLSTSINANQLEVFIEDNGYGIKEENIHKVTDPFFTTKEPGKGTGLGLSVAYKIVKEHKGSLKFSSKVNKGTSVTIVLPLII